MASSFTRNEISMLLECAICLDVVKNPRRLACEHFFCKSCLDKLLEFAVDGSCIIRCPKKCEKYTLIPNNCTTNDLGVDYMMNGMIEMVANNEKSLNLVKNKPTCDASTYCNKDISIYCPYCNSFLCKSCRCHHAQNQYFPVTYNTDDDQIKVTCEKHSTEANYLCCGPCDNEFICVYCSHRDHVGHSYDKVQNQVPKIKDNLQKEIKNIGDFNQKLDSTLQQTESDISVSKYVLDETLTYRKLLCLNDYLHFLNKEEERLNAEFYSITVNHRKQYKFKENYTEFYKKSASEEGISIVMQIKNILNNISLHNKVNITEEIISLSGHCFNANNPLGNINIEAGKGIAVGGSRCFKSNLVNMGDNSMGNNAAILYENLQYLLQQCFPKNKEISGRFDPVLLDNLMQENERLKDNLMKLENQNEEVVAVNNNWEEAYNSLTQQYNELQNQFEESNKQFIDEIAKTEEENNRSKAMLERFGIKVDSNGKILDEEEEDDMYCTMEEWQGPLTASMLIKLSRREQKQKIGEQLLPLVMKLEPFDFVYLMDILLKIDNPKLLNMLESPQLLSAEVGVALQYFKARNNKERVARYVDRAMASDEKFQLHSWDLNKEEPLTLSHLETVSLREQKQMIGERLLPLVQEIAPSEFVYVMDSLLKIDNVKLLNMLESHQFLSAEVERAIHNSKAQNDKERIACYVVKAMSNNRN